MFLFLLQRGSAFLAHPNLLVSANFTAYAYRSTCGANQLHVGKRYTALLLGDPALDVALRVGSHMFLDQHDVLDQDFGIVGKDPQYAAFFAFIASGDHPYGVIVANIDSNVFSDHGLHNYFNPRLQFLANLSIA